MLRIRRRRLTQCGVKNLQIFIILLPSKAPQAGAYSVHIDVYIVELAISFLVYIFILLQQTSKKSGKKIATRVDSIFFQIYWTNEGE